MPRTTCHPSTARYVSSPSYVFGGHAVDDVRGEGLKVHFERALERGLRKTNDRHRDLIGQQPQRRAEHDTGARSCRLVPDEPAVERPDRGAEGEMYKARGDRQVALRETSFDRGSRDRLCGQFVCVLVFISL